MVGNEIGTRLGKRHEEKPGGGGEWRCVDGGGMGWEIGGGVGCFVAETWKREGSLVSGWLAGWWMAMKGNVVVVVLFILVRRPGWRES